MFVLKPDGVDIIVGGKAILFKISIVNGLATCGQDFWLNKGTNNDHNKIT